MTPLNRLERTLFGQSQILVARKDWPVYRAAILALEEKYAGRHMAETCRVAREKHDEEYAKPGDDTAILCPMVGTGMVFSNRRAVIIDLNEHPEERGL